MSALHSSVFTLPKNRIHSDPLQLQSFQGKLYVLDLVIPYCGAQRGSRPFQYRNGATHSMG